MNNEKIEMNVFLINVKKTKTNKSVLKYAYPIKETNYSKGLFDTIEFFEGYGLFDKLKNENFGLPLVCHYVLEERYDGSFTKKIVDIIKDGEYIFG